MSGLVWGCVEIVSLFEPEIACAASVDASIWTELGKVQSLSAKFTQTQYRAILKTPLVSTGSVSFVRPGRLDWKVETPAKSTFVLDGSVATMDYPELGMSERIDLAQVPEANQLATSMMVWLKADPEAVARDFDVTYMQSPPGAVLKPKSGTLKSLLAEIRLSLTPGPWRVSKVELLEPDNDRVEIVFQSVVLDGKAI